MSEHSAENEACRAVSISDALARRIMLRLGQEIQDTHEYQAACRVIQEFTTRVIPPEVGQP